MSGYVVTAPLVLARNPAGAFEYLYLGAALPELADGEVKRLKDGGFIESVAPAKPASQSAAEKKAAAEKAAADKAAAEQAAAEQAAAEKAAADAAAAAQRA